MSAELPKVLCVDDEPRVLEGLTLNLEWDYRVETTTSAAAGLRMLKEAEEEGDPFCVVISDMRMPGMDGAAFLEKVRERHNDTTRMLLTGYADLESAMRAVNQGAIFRIMTKPCPEESLLSSVRDAVRQYQLLHTEKELLNKTLKGAARALYQTLAIASPLVFSRATAINGYMEHLLEFTDVEEPWMFELAAMFVLVGFISIPGDVAQKVISGRTLSAQEQAMVDRCPELAYELLQQIPRLEAVGLMIKYHQDPGKVDSEDPNVHLGAKMLQVCTHFDRLILQGLSPNKAVAVLLQKNACERAFVSILSSYQRGSESVERLVGVRDLCVSMIPKEDILTEAGQLILKGGEPLTQIMIQRIRNFDCNLGVKQPIMVCMERETRAV